MDIERAEDGISLEGCPGSCLIHTDIERAEGGILYGRHVFSHVVFQPKLIQIVSFYYITGIQE